MQLRRLLFFFFVGLDSLALYLWIFRDPSDGILPALKTFQITDRDSTLHATTDNTTVKVKPKANAVDLNNEDFLEEVARFTTLEKAKDLVAKYSKTDQAVIMQLIRYHSLQNLSEIPPIVTDVDMLPWFWPAKEEGSFSHSVKPLGARPTNDSWMSNLTIPLWDSFERFRVVTEEEAKRAATYYDADPKRLTSAMRYTNSTRRLPFATFGRQYIELYGIPCVGDFECSLVVRHFIGLQEVAVGHVLIIVGARQKPSVLPLLLRLVSLFPGRFSVFRKPFGLSCAQSFNTIARVGFTRMDPRPFMVQIANADYYPEGDGFKSFLSKIGLIVEGRPTTIYPFGTNNWIWSNFGLPFASYRDIGPFDEAIAPAAIEDLDFMMRARWVGLGGAWAYDDSFTATHYGGGSTSQKALPGQSEVEKPRGGWASWDYLMRKHNFFHYENPPADGEKPFSHPFNLSWLPVNASFIDPVHQQCIYTKIARDRYPLMQPSGNCIGCGACYWNATIALEPYMHLAPPGSSLPNWLTSQNLHYIRPKPDENVTVRNHWRDLKLAEGLIRSNGTEVEYYMQSEDESLILMRQQQVDARDDDLRQRFQGLRDDMLEVRKQLSNE